MLETYTGKHFIRTFVTGHYVPTPDRFCSNELISFGGMGKQS